MNKLPEEPGIRAVIAHYAEGMRTHNVESLKRAFHEQAILCGYLGDDLIAGPIAELYAWVGANPSPAASGDPYSCDILNIDVTGRIASASVRELYHDTAIDYFHLLKTGDTWSIVSKLWDSES
jgi:Putative lumazine-binding